MTAPLKSFSAYKAYKIIAEIHSFSMSVCYKKVQEAGIYSELLLCFNKIYKEEEQPFVLLERRIDLWIRF